MADSIRFISKTDLAILGKCTKSLITKNCKEGGPFYDAMQTSGRLDMDHPIIKAWLVKREIIADPSALTLAKYEKLTVKEIVMHYGSVDALEGFIKTRKLIVETEAKLLAVEASRDELVSREFIGKTCFGILETALSRLLDMPKASVEKISAVLETAIPGCKEQSEEILAKEISKILEGAKTEIIRTLEWDLVDATKKAEAE